MIIWLLLLLSDNSPLSSQANQHLVTKNVVITFLTYLLNLLCGILINITFPSSIAEKIGTRDSKIEGILDRITLLKRDFYLKKMFNKTPEKNLDFVAAMEEGKVIFSRFAPFI